MDITFAVPSYHIGLSQPVNIPTILRLWKERNHGHHPPCSRTYQLYSIYSCFLFLVTIDKLRKWNRRSLFWMISSRRCGFLRSGSSLLCTFASLKIGASAWNFTSDKSFGGYQLLWWRGDPFSTRSWIDMQDVHRVYLLKNGESVNAQIAKYWV